MAYQCEGKYQAAQPVMSIHTHTPVKDLPQTLGQTYGKIMQHLTQLGQAPSGAPFVAYYNMDMENLDLEIGFPVAEPLPPVGDIQANQIPEGMVATCIHTGPYTDLQAAYQELTTWVNQNGYTPTGTVYEFYFNSPVEVPPEQLQTQIVFPVVKANI